MDYFADRSWAYVDKMGRMDDFFRDGVKFFIKFAFGHKVEGSKTITCLCTKCKNMNHNDKDLVEHHLVVNGFMPGYTKWYFHGEPSKRPRWVSAMGDNMHRMINDALDSMIMWMSL